MIWQLIYTIFLLGMFFEVAREAYGTEWASRHFTRMVSFSKTNRPPQDFWTERKSRWERRAHRRRWHIDLLDRSSIRRLKK